MIKIQVSKFQKLIRSVRLKKQFFLKIDEFNTSVIEEGKNNVEKKSAERQLGWILQNFLYTH